MSTFVQEVTNRGCIIALHGDKLLFKAPTGAGGDIILFVKEHREQIIQELKSGEQLKIIPAWCRGLDCSHCFAGQVYSWNDVEARVLPAIRFECFINNTFSPLGKLHRCSLVQKRPTSHW